MERLDFDKEKLQFVIAIGELLTACPFPQVPADHIHNLVLYDAGFCIIEHR